MTPRQRAKLANSVSMLDIVTPGIVRVPGYRVEEAMPGLVITTREELPQAKPASLRRFGSGWQLFTRREEMPRADRDWRWAQHMDLPPCEHCGRDAGQTELGLLFETNKRGHTQKVACLDSVCMDCARALIAANSTPSR